MLLVVDLGFPKGVGMFHATICQNIYRKLHENERNWTGVARPSTSAFESANRYKNFY